MVFKRRNISYQNKKQKTTEISLNNKQFHRKSLRVAGFSDRTDLDGGSVAELGEWATGGLYGALHHRTPSPTELIVPDRFSAPIFRVRIFKIYAPSPTTEARKPGREGRITN
ncbi:hypothetical protein AAG570_007636 [Ranatra chinensis]|uniref:Uncharacterized protein n=1 Tax=Ranatra chinensis TaxID=642074 RepID=A0ABD0XU32_9HEMI